MTPLLIGLLVFGFASLVVWTILGEAQERAEMRESLRAIQGYEVESLREQQLSLPLRTRLLAPMGAAVANVGRAVVPSGYLEGARKRLVRAGRPTADDLDRWRAWRLLTVVLAPVVMLLALWFFPDSRSNALLAGGFLAFALIALPDATLNRKVAERQHAIRVQLPDVLDLLVISVEAGLGFEQALDRTVTAVPGALSDEFARMLGEVRAGAGRSDAMRAFDERIQVPEVHSFTLALLQADTFGVSIGRVLRVQAEEMRVRRRQLAQEEAQKAPVKMLIPMVTCIFPALFVIVLAPAVIGIAEAF